MRTSKIHRDTVRVVDALSSGRPTRRSIRQFGQFAHDSEASIAATKDDSITQGPGAEASSDLSSPPTSPSNSASDYEAEELESSPKQASRKRKRSTAQQTSTPIKRETVVKTEIVSPAISSKPKAVRRKPAKHIKGENGSRPSTSPPANWEQVYAMTAEMRKKVIAPVDTMGCESLAEDHRTPLEQRLQTLISLMLSSQTKDTINAVVMRNLQQNLEGGLTLESLLKVEPERLNELIWQVGFHNNKTKFIKATAEILRDRFGGDIPDTIEGMVSLPGVGPKMAYLCMSAAWGRDEGIGVDVHVHRITNLWGWHKTRMPEETRAELESWLPRDKWHDINHLLVGFGQTICLPVGRKCGQCTLAETGLCPSAVIPKEVKKRVKKEVIKHEADEVKVESAVKDEIVIKEEKANEDAPGLEVPPVGSLPDMEDMGRGSRRSSRKQAHSS